ncbi:hypothetical protein L1F30_09815 [Simiduia sp. 21SJ11W-1]|uniref:spermidine synthase n=1 Tax=Simiduia sp. 21SJ11W-1 TaxID=2909669 RepID=UPI00209E2A12|nr:hypothetical protein [Simiduia sp. 21SJ11W-1]UTA46470.1 hypothetical protein L1F30_09815 [Simiduia sp. 21SJ11W-1]
MPDRTFPNHLLKALAHRKQRALLQTRDEHGDIFVYEQYGKRVLTFDERFEQSAMDLQHPQLPSHRYIRAMLLALALCEPPGRALHLGLGGGALIRAMAAICPACEHTAVELRSSVKLIAEQYFLAPPLLPAGTQLRIHCDDARRFVKTQAARGIAYDMIFSDIYLAGGMDVHQRSERYLADCAQSLSPRGWLVLNYTQLPRFDDPSFKALGMHFNEVLIAGVEAANYVVFAGKQALARPLAALAPQAATLGSQVGIDLMRQFKHLQQLKDFFEPV